MAPIYRYPESKPEQYQYDDANRELYVRAEVLFEAAALRFAAAGCDFSVWHLGVRKNFERSLFVK